MGDHSDPAEYAPLKLHIPEPAVRPGDAPDFSNVVIPKAGQVARPELNANPESMRDLAYSIIRVLNRDGEAVGPWAGLLWRRRSRTTPRSRLRGSATARRQ